MSEFKSSKDIVDGLGEKNKFTRYLKALAFIVMGIAAFLGAIKGIQEFFSSGPPPPPPPVSAPPTAGFEFPESTGTVPFAVRFSNQSTGDSTTYFWDFGDGETSTEESPGHTYRNASFVFKPSGGCFEKKAFTVSLTATNRLGEDRMVKEIFVQPETYELTLQAEPSFLSGHFDLMHNPGCSAACPSINTLPGYASQTLPCLSGTSSKTDKTGYYFSGQEVGIQADHFVYYTPDNGAQQIWQFDRWTTDIPSTQQGQVSVPDGDHFAVIKEINRSQTVIAHYKRIQ